MVFGLVNGTPDEITLSVPRFFSTGSVIRVEGLGLQDNVRERDEERERERLKVFIREK